MTVENSTIARSSRLENPVLELTVQVFDDPEQSKADVEKFLSDTRRHVAARYDFKHISVKPSPKYYEETSHLLKYEICFRRARASYSFCRFRFLQWWCYLMHFWAFPTDKKPNWERSHLLRDTFVTIGNLIAPSVFIEHHVLSNACTVFEHSLQLINIYVDKQAAGLIRMSIRYNQVRRMLVNIIDSNHVNLFLHLKTVPLLSHVDAGQVANQRHSARASNKELHDEDIVSHQRCHDLSRVDINLPNASQYGACLTMRISVTCSTETMINMLSRLSRKIAHHGEVAYCKVTNRVPKQVGWRIDNEISDLPLSQLSSFEVQYGLYALFSWSDEISDQLHDSDSLKNVFCLIVSMEAKSHHALYRTIKDIFKAVENGAIFSFERALRTLFAIHDQSLIEPSDEEHSHIPGTAYIRRIFITPTRKIFRFPELHTQNRILRNFEPDYAIRVCFRDDNLEKLTFAIFNMKTKESFLKEVVGRHLCEGLKIGSRRYDFVAASSSQLRDHGVWVYARDQFGFEAETIRGWMGDFHDINNVATRMARMGQCFSSTQETVEILPEEELHWRDITHFESVHPLSGRPYCFSDGCGKISQELMQQVWCTLPHHAMELHPSALQIRYRGCKGMISLDTTLPGRKLVLRESMIKFQCTSPRKLEVIKWSAPMNMFLNRSLIAILEHHGIRTDVFLRLQLEMIMQVADSLVCEASALRVLTSFVKTPVPFAGLAEVGWELVRDPFIIQMLYDLLKNALVNLKVKANVAIPVNEGRNMLGVVDETGILDYGQVFIQFTEMPYTDVSNARVRIVEGDVVITKCPCMHPGDVRRLRAVDVPQLRHIRDCVVFPSRGKAPHPFEMSGSDLDGDEYVCIWSEELIFERNAMPYVYDDKPFGVNPFKHNSDETNFFCNYIGNDIIGIISNAHLAWADQAGIASEKCLALVGKASKALDFAKTGDAADLYPNEKPEKFPDFMEKGDHKHSYQSQKALGILYRTVRQIMAVNDTMLSKGNIAPLEVPGWQMFRERAQAALQRYNERLAHIMEQHGVVSEGEVFSGVIGTVNTFDAVSTSSFRAEKANIALLIERQKCVLMEETKQQFQCEFEEDCALFGARTEEDRHMIRIQKASAWYMVTYTEDAAYFSFPWSIGHALLEAKRWIRDFSSHGNPRESSDSVARNRNILIRVVDECASQEGGLSWSLDPRPQVRFHINQWLGEVVKSRPELNDSICDLCYAQIYEAFVHECVEPMQLSTVGEYLVSLLTFLASGRCTYPKLCDRKACRRFFGSDCPLLTVEASKAYVRFAINKDACFFGFRCNQKTHRASTIIVDAPPEKLNISETFWRFLRSDRTRRCQDHLKKWTGVPYITVRYQRHKTRRYIPSMLPANMSILQLRLAAFPNSNLYNMPGTFTMSNTYSMKVHYCGTDVQIFAMQQCLRNENFQAAILEGNYTLLKQ
ncbi:RNA-dependent RNA polymerase 2 [Galendromus occidentalis]|uniref:RNA-dependent RNA polymerase n=1 Tax=Galendromus occidentalis TaxID=34638 RepID=A0AAJ7SDH7_9ACAR|nr:RNA-dependent RNA polymerase 2 [Galendromus occidentalis]